MCRIVRISDGYWKDTRNSYLGLLVVNTWIRQIFVIYIWGILSNGGGWRNYRRTASIMNQSLNLKPAHNKNNQPTSTVVSIGHMRRRKWFWRQKLFVIVQYKKNIILQFIIWRKMWGKFFWFSVGVHMPPLSKMYLTKQGQSPFSQDDNFDLSVDQPFAAKRNTFPILTVNEYLADDSLILHHDSTIAELWKTRKNKTEKSSRWVYTFEMHERWNDDNVNRVDSRNSWCGWRVLDPMLLPDYCLLATTTWRRRHRSITVETVSIRSAQTCPRRAFRHNNKISSLLRSRDTKQTDKPCYKEKNAIRKWRISCKILKSKMENTLKQFTQW